MPTSDPVAVVGKLDEQCFTILITTYRHGQHGGAIESPLGWPTYERLDLRRFKRRVLLRVNHGFG
jgi:hypothetical protein